MTTASSTQQVELQQLELQQLELQQLQFKFYSEDQQKKCINIICNNLNISNIYLVTINLDNVERQMGTFLTSLNGGRPAEEFKAH